MDPRFEKFAHVLVNNSIETQKGDIVIIDTWEETPMEMVLALIHKVQEVGALPISWRTSQQILAATLKKADERLLRIMGLGHLSQLAASQKYIVIRAFDNIYELADVPADKMDIYGKHYLNMVQEERIEYKRWILSRWPTPAMAQMAQMPTERFTNHFFDVVLLDYKKMERAIKPLKRLMLKTDKVHIKGPGTNLRFSIKGIPVVPCIGKRNIPDGECYTAPVRNSVNGTITYNTKTITKEGQAFEGVSFTFKDGKIIKASCQSGDPKRLNQILNTDEGARYVGEFSFGFNPYITDTIGDTLFDEKVAGSIHFTPGKAYKGAYNGNDSKVHWDIVLVQTKEKGGGEIWFDGKLIRKDGLFVPKELAGLNPEDLKAA